MRVTPPIALSANTLFLTIAVHTDAWFQLSAQGNTSRLRWRGRSGWGHRATVEKEFEHNTKPENSMLTANNKERVQNSFQAS